MHVREVEQVVEVVRVRYPASESSIGEERESSRWGEIEREGVTSESLKLAGGDARESIGLCSVCVVSVRGASGGREIEITWRTISKSSLSHVLSTDSENEGSLSVGNKTWTDLDEVSSSLAPIDVSSERGSRYCRPMAPVRLAL